MESNQSKMMLAGAALALLLVAGVGIAMAQSNVTADNSTTPSGATPAVGAHAGHHVCPLDATGASPASTGASSSNANASA